MTETIIPPEGFHKKNFTQVISLMVGFILCILGASGLLYPSFAGLHLSTAHSLITFIAGATLFYNGGWKDNGLNAFACCLGFGLFFFLLSIAGFTLGSPGVPTIGHIQADPNLLVIKEGFIEYGRFDHLLNFAIGFFLLLGALDWGRRMGKTPRNKNRPRRHYKLATHH